MSGLIYGADLYSEKENAVHRLETSISNEQHVPQRITKLGSYS